MAGQNRRDFLKSAALIGAGAAGLSSQKTNAQVMEANPDDRIGVLVDTTVCIGCRSCEWACKDAHALPTEAVEVYQNDRTVFENERRPNDAALTIVNEYKSKGLFGLPVDVKIQCMHCEDPLCVENCPASALSYNDRVDRRTLQHNMTNALDAVNAGESVRSAPSSFNIF